MQYDAMLLHAHLSMNGLLFGWPRGVPNTSVNSAAIILQCGDVSNLASNDSSGLLPFIQLPVSLSSSIVCTFIT
jgi:hypothetical protein